MKVKLLFLTVFFLSGALAQVIDERKIYVDTLKSSTDAKFVVIADSAFLKSYLKFDSTGATYTIDFSAEDDASATKYWLYSNATNYWRRDGQASVGGKLGVGTVPSHNIHVKSTSVPTVAVVGDGVGAEIVLYGVAGQQRNFFIGTGNTLIGTNDRWVFGGDGAAESGGNAGTNFRIARKSDTGVELDTTLGINRATGKVTLADDLAVNGAGTISGNLTINGGTLIGAATQNIFNTISTTINAFGAATTIGMGAASGVWTLGSNSTINGGAAANDDITIRGTSHATRTSSYVFLQPNGGNVKMGNSVTAPILRLHVDGVQGIPEATGTLTKGSFFVGNNTNNNGIAMGNYATPFASWIQSTNWGGTENDYNLILQPNGGNVGIEMTTPFHKQTTAASTATNLNAFNFVNTNINTTVSSLAEEIDTSSFSMKFSGTGSPTLTLKGKTGNTVLQIDSAGIGAESFVADTSAFVTSATRAAVYIAGATFTNKYALSVRRVNGDDTLPVADDGLAYYAKTDSLIVLRVAGTTSGLKFSYVRIK